MTGEEPELTAEPPGPNEALDSDPPAQTLAAEPDERDGPGVASRLFETEGGKPLPAIQDEYEVGKPTALICRGIMKIARKAGFPAVADIVAGIFLWAAAAGGGDRKTPEVGPGGGSDDELPEGLREANPTADEPAG